MFREKKTPAHCVAVDCDLDFPYEKALQHTIEAALGAEQVPVPCVVEVLITDDAGIHKTNLEFRNVDAPTDVLSFPMFDLAPGEHPTARDADPGTDKVYLGDIVISFQRARDQALEYGHSVERELCYLAVHSVLHLLGYDHMDDGPMKAQMRAREEAILGELGITRG